MNSLLKYQSMTQEQEKKESKAIIRGDKRWIAACGFERDSRSSVGWTSKLSLKDHQFGDACMVQVGVQHTHAWGSSLNTRLQLHFVIWICEKHSKWWCMFSSLPNIIELSLKTCIYGENIGRRMVHKMQSISFESSATVCVMWFMSSWEKGAILHACTKRGGGTLWWQVTSNHWHWKVRLKGIPFKRGMTQIIGK